MVKYTLTAGVDPVPRPANDTLVIVVAITSVALTLLPAAFLSKTAFRRGAPDAVAAC